MHLSVLIFMTCTLLFYRYNNRHLLQNIRSLWNFWLLFCGKWVIPSMELLPVQNISTETHISNHETCYPQVYALPGVKQNVSSVTGYGLDDRDSNPNRDKYSSLCHYVQIIFGCSLPGGSAAGAWSWPSSPYRPASSSSSTGNISPFIYCSTNAFINYLFSERCQYLILYSDE
jgi:hypothetical protein